MQVDRITGWGGAVVPVYTTGTGPGIVVLHGGGVAARDYHRLARAWSDRFTVHLYNRRGRPDTAPLDGGETVETDLEDLAAVLAHTGARNVFGHSGGAFVALRAGLRLPLDRIAVYDPGMTVDGLGPLGFLEPFETAVRAGDYARALTVMARATYPDDLGAKLPFGVALRLTKVFLRTPVGRRFAELLPTVPPELRRLADHGGPAGDYAGITADVLLAYGSRSPRQFGQICAALAGAIPRGRAATIPRSPHNAANVARSRFTAPFADFFAARSDAERVD